MKYAKYDIDPSNACLECEFHSDGPKGRIIKSVTFEQMNDSPEVYNLGFGDVRNGVSAAF